MYNKKGILRIVEATVAVLIVLGVIVAVSLNGVENDEKDLVPIITPLLLEMAKNSNYRDMILNYDIHSGPEDGNNKVIRDELKEFVGERMSGRAVSYEVNICNPDFACPFPGEYPSKSLELYAAERIVSTDVGKSQFEPRKVKVFLWIE